MLPTLLVDVPSLHLDGRPSEVKEHLPIMLEALPEIEKEIGEFQCIIPLAESLDFDQFRSKSESTSVHLTVVHGQFKESVMACDAAASHAMTDSLNCP